MHRKRFIAAFVIAFWVLTPEIVCLFPGAMPVEADHCARIPKPDIQKCCNALVQPKAVVTAKADEYGHSVPVTLPVIPSTIETVREAAFDEHWLAHLIWSSPPSVSLESLSILRI